MQICLRVPSDVNLFAITQPCCYFWSFELSLRSYRSIEVANVWASCVASFKKKQMESTCGRSHSPFFHHTKEILIRDNSKKKWYLSAPCLPITFRSLILSPELYCCCCFFHFFYLSCAAFPTPLTLFWCFSFTLFNNLFEIGVRWWNQRIFQIAKNKKKALNELTHHTCIQIRYQNINIHSNWVSTIKKGLI